MATKSLSAYATLKRFCHQEGFIYTKRARDTNNGVLVLLEVRTGKAEGQGAIFSKVKWFKQTSNLKDNIFNLLAFEFFEAIGVPLVNSEYWLVGTKPQKKITPQKIEIKEALTFEEQLDEALAEAEDEPEPTRENTVEIKNPADPTKVLGDFSKMMSGIEDQSFNGLMTALSTPGGLAQVGGLLQNPMFSQIMSGMMGGLAVPPAAQVNKEVAEDTPIVLSATSEILLEKE